MPGRRFTLRNHPRTDQNRELIITRAHYDVVNNDYEGTTGSDDGVRFDVEIEALPANRQYRAGQPSPKKPRARGPETAVVVGPAGSEIHTDQYGRVKVHFHWDRYGQKDGQDSCWIRVAYPWAGSNFGGIHIPRVGQEVIVDYEYGDPDRPIITGRVYNAGQMPPWDLPANQTQSGFLTRSSLGGTPANANALRFEDAKGKEQVWLHAERNQDIEVENDETHSVGGNRRKTIIRNEIDWIYRNWSIKVALSKTETIGKIYAQKVGLARLEFVGMAYSLNVGAAYNINVGAAINTNVGAAINTNVGAGYILTVGGAMATTVCKMYALIVGGNSQIAMEKDSITLKTGNSEISLSGDGTISLKGSVIKMTADLIEQN
jgi:type VI secretion system secreted protein VgrG